MVLRERRVARADRRRSGVEATATLVLLAGWLWATSAAAVERKAQVTGISDRALVAALERAVGDEPGPPANRLDARRRAQSAAEGAEALLRSEGYYDAEITPDVGEGERPKAILRITLGPRTFVKGAEIVWDGAAPPPAVESKARAALSLPDGTPAQAGEVLAAEGRAMAALERAGFADAVAEPREVTVDHADHTLRPVYRIAAGAVVRLGDLTLPRRGRTAARYVRGLAPWKPGDAYSPAKVAELERRLTETQAYDTVAVALAPKADAVNGLRPVVVSLTDRARRAFDFSAGYSTTEGPDFDIRYSVFNTLHRADTITLEARLAQIDSRAGGELSLPNYGAPGRTAKTSAYYFRTVTDAYSETGGIVSSELTQRFGPTSFVTLGASVTDSRVSDKELGAANLVVVRGVAAFLWDRTDNTLNPSRGFKLDARLVPTVAEGDANQVYLRMVSQLSGYLALGRGGGTVLAGRVRLGSIVGGSIPAVPAQDRFFAGGGGSVRGYDFQGVGPRYADDTPRGGLSLLETSLELRQRIGQTKFGVVGFIDAGAVGDTAAPDFHRVSPSVGVGVRYDLGFAPVRVDIATPLQKTTRASQSAFQLYLSIGQAF
jgi:translocation and assembly module TamA